MTRRPDMVASPPLSLSISETWVMALVTACAAVVVWVAVTS